MGERTRIPRIPQEEWIKCTTSSPMPCQLIQGLDEEFVNIELGGGWRNQVDDIRQEIDEIRGSCQAHQKLNSGPRRYWPGRVKRILALPCVGLLCDAVDLLGGEMGGPIYGEAFKDGQSC